MFDTELWEYMVIRKFEREGAFLCRFLFWWVVRRHVRSLGEEKDVGMASGRLENRKP